jgi:hypothetical protein
MNKKSKKQPVKRKYTKRANNIFNSESEFKAALDEFTTPDPKKEFDEIEFLNVVVSGLEQLLPDQKSRFINYIYSRYSRFITISKLTQ